MNLYGYCGNSPLNWADPYGLCKSRRGSFLNWAQGGLDVAGMFPGLGVLADTANPTVNSIKIYINGSEDISVTVAVGTVPIATDTLNSNVWIGAYQLEVMYCNGLIDDVRIYDRALSDQEIAEMAQ